MPDLFALPVFFITFREALETAIIVSVLLAFLKQTLADRPASDDDDSGAQQQQRRHLYRKMVRQVWLGTASGLLVCVVLGGLLITVFHEVELPDGAEDVWEGVFSLIASVIITLVGAVLLRVSKLQDKWTAKLAAVMSAKDRPAVARGTGGAWAQMRSRMAYASEKYALFVLPFVTVLREGFEGVVFIAGVGMAFPPSSIPLAALAGLVAGSALGFLIYEYGLSSDFLCQTSGSSNFAPIQYFLVFSTCFLYLVAAGLFSKGVWHLEASQWNMIVGGDAAELGSGPGSYDIDRSVWHVNCCNPDINGGGAWGVFNALLGWQNSATIGSVVSYNLYWVVVAAGFLCMIYNERTGQWPTAAVLGGGKNNKTLGVKDSIAASGDDAYADRVREPLLAGGRDD
ncbi:uncharacterized protein E0L32_010345 [Thyridium curvatum]|uniref:Plasma membrane iron permease n=1 Tax=Thyridium curvatum TaxID=1093900 RepID=A0A507ANQ5_9PEZI|nr:uncharacterized protein E0L32_010345 [Thyridium curvatum]TPX08014.1 hypothetical protein E0L32_010345 [Thyridium curvatum]